MSYLVTVKHLASILSLSRQRVYEKIKKKSIPEEVLIHIPSIKKKAIRIDVELLSDLNPDFKQLLTAQNVDFKKKETSNFIKVADIANVLSVSIDNIYKGIEYGIYPIVDLSAGVGDRRIIRILKKETIEKYPQLERILNKI